MEVEEKDLLSATSSLLADKGVFSAVVANLLSKQNGISKGELLPSDSSHVVLSNGRVKDAKEPDDQESNSLTDLSTTPANDNAFTQSLEQVHALATANLLASTQHDIVKQLAEAVTATFPAPPEENKRPTTAKHNVFKEKKLKSVKTTNDKKETSAGAVVSQSDTPEPKALTCSFEGCNRKFAWSTHLKYHEMTHTDNRQFECPDSNCGKLFFTAQRLKVHIRTHTGEKPFKCSHADCGKTFTTAGNLKNHERIHTGEQPFSCDFDGCDRRFTEYSSLHKHKLTHSGDRPFKCSLCNKSFTQSGSRRQHLLRHHLDQEIRNSLKPKTFPAKSNAGMKCKGRSNTSKTAGVVESSRPNNVSSSATQASPMVVFSNGSKSHPSTGASIFSQCLNEQLMTVSTSHQNLSEPTGLLSPGLLTPDGVSTTMLGEKADELVILSQASVFNNEDQEQEIVNSSSILDHEMTTAGYYHHHHHQHHQLSSSQTEPARLHSPLNYHHPGDGSVQKDISLHHSSEPHPSDIYQSYENFMHQEHPLHDPESYSEIKDLPSTYLTAGGEVLHDDFIGTEEVIISSSSGMVVVNTSREGTEDRIYKQTDRPL